MDDGLAKLSKLPSVTNALKLSKPEFREITTQFLKYAGYCDFMTPEKFSDWCNYMKCSRGQCGRDVNGYLIGLTTSSTIASFGAIPTHCYDIWFCHPSWSDVINHYCLGIIGCILLLLALIFTLIYLPSFTCYGHSLGTDILLTALACVDIFYILILIILDCVPYFNKIYQHQVDTYSNFIVYLVPFLSPLKEFANTLSCWILLCLLFEEFLFQHHGKYAKSFFNKRSIIFYLLVFSSILFSFTILKFFNLHAIIRWNGKYQVYLTNIGNNLYYHNLITSWLKVPLEYFGPILCFVILLTGIFSELSSQISRNGASHISSNKDNNNKIYKNLLHNFVLINENQREGRIMIGLILMSIISCLIKLMEFLHHILSTENANISLTNMFNLKLIYTLLTIIFLFIKPFIYLSITPKYYRAIGEYCFCSRLGKLIDRIRSAGHIHNSDCIEISDCTQYSNSKPDSFEETVTSRMRDSISYRHSVFAPSSNHVTITVSLADDYEAEG